SKELSQKFSAVLSKQVKDLVAVVENSERRLSHGIKLPRRDAAPRKRIQRKQRYPRHPEELRRRDIITLDFEGSISDLCRKPGLLQNCDDFLPAIYPRLRNRCQPEPHRASRDFGEVYERKRSERRVLPRLDVSAVRLDIDAY